MASYTEEDKTTILDTICERLSNGEALRTVLKDKDMPSSSTFFIWIDNDEDKSKQYARACANRADAIFDEALEIADTPKEGVVTKIDKDGNKEVTHADMIAHRKLQVDTRKWAAGKLNPKKYGDKLQTEHSGEIEIKQITGMELK